MVVDGRASQEPKVMHFYPHHIGDYQRDTAHLSATDHGVYRLLMDHYYVTEKPLPGDIPTLCRIVRAVSKAERDSVLRVVSSFFRSSDKGFTHKRIEAEIVEYRRKSEAAASAGKASGEARRAKRNANEKGTDVERTFDSRSPSVGRSVEPTSNHEPVTSSSFPKEAKGATPPPAPGKAPTKRQVMEADIREADETPLPLDLQSKEFRDQWDDWCLHRAELYRRNAQKRWTGLAARNTLNECARHGAEVACMAIRAAIANGWQGLVWDRLAAPQNGHPAKEPLKSFKLQEQEAREAARFGTERIVPKLL